MSLLNYDRICITLVLHLSSSLKHSFAPNPMVENGVAYMMSTNCVVKCNYWKIKKVLINQRIIYNKDI